MTKKEVINELEAILKQTKLSPRAASHEARQRFDWFNTIGRSRLVAVIERLKEGLDRHNTGG